MKLRHCSNLFFVIIIALFICELSIPSLATSAFPSKPITYIINYGPGGGTDTMSRALIQAAEKELGVSIVPQNVQGGAGSKGLMTVAKAKPDGYTLGNLSMVPLALVPHTLGVPYDSINDFTFILGFGKYTSGVIVKKDAQWQTFKDLVAYVRDNPGKVKIADGTPGGFICLGLKWLEMKENISFKWIPYNGAGPSMAALLGGHVDITCNNPPGIVRYLGSDHIRMLASMSEDRHSDMNAPTFKEMGWNFAQTSWAGVGAPKGLPEDVRQKLHDAFKKAMQSEGFMKIMNKMHVPIEYASGERYKKMVGEYSKVWGNIIETTGYGK